jgi:DNA-binding MarR family transcriptional regulator
MAWALMVQAHAIAFDRIEADMVREAGLPLAWHEVLARLAASEDPAMRMQDVARAVLLSKSGLTRLADRMEQAGLIQRRACASDRRGVFLGLTPAGHEALERARPVFAAAIEHHFGRHLGPEDLDGITAAARRLIEGSGETVDEGCANP